MLVLLGRQFGFFLVLPSPLVAYGTLQHPPQKIKAAKGCHLGLQFLR